MLSVKVMAPTFRVLRSNSLVLDGTKKGRILLEWTPRTADGAFALTSGQRCSVHHASLLTSNYNFPHCSLQVVPLATVSFDLAFLRKNLD